MRNLKKLIFLISLFCIGAVIVGCEGGQDQNLPASTPTPELKRVVPPTYVTPVPEGTTSQEGMRLLQKAINATANELGHTQFWGKYFEIENAAFSPVPISFNLIFITDLSNGGAITPAHIDNFYQNLEIVRNWLTEVWNITPEDIDGHFGVTWKIYTFAIMPEENISQ